MLKRDENRVANFLFLFFILGCHHKTISVYYTIISLKNKKKDVLMSGENLMLQRGYIQLYKKRPGCPGCLVLSETGGSVVHPKAGPVSLGGLMARHPLQVASSPDTAPRVPGIIRSSPTSPGVSWRAPGPGPGGLNWAHPSSQATPASRWAPPAGQGSPDTCHPF